VLPLKLWRPALFSGTALVIGSVAPDFEYLLATMGVHTTRGFTHSVAGQIVFCLPVTLGLVWLVGRLGLGATFVSRTRGRPGWLARAATDVTRPGGLLRAAESALLGSFSHLALDALTHRFVPRWLPDRSYRVAHILFTPQAIGQIAASFVGAAVTVWLLHRLSVLSPPVPVTPRRGGWLIVALSVLGTGIGALGARPMVRHPDAYFAAGRLYVWGHVVFVVGCGAAAGALLASLLLAAWDRFTRARPAGKIEGGAAATGQGAAGSATERH
jgi:membrane-bound metal-dependent hydrolase YbcI (DUF457 family)